MKKVLTILLAMSAMTVAMAQSAKCDVSTIALMKRQSKAGATQFRMIAKTVPDFSTANFEKQGIVVGTHAGQLTTLTVPAEAVAWLDSCPEVLEYSISHPIGGPYCENTTYDTRTDSVKRGLGVIGDTSFNGAGVYIGVTDWGFDYRHINFNNRALDNRRIERVWDQFREAGPAPSGYNYGTEIIGSDAVFEAECDTLNIYEHGTHGTHVTGIAAGRGVKNSEGNYEYQGQAPYAKLLLSSFLLDEASWLDAAGWMKSVAEADGKRLVINSSWGMYTFSSLEGQSHLSQMIDAMSDEGVIFCTSAGNNGNKNCHISYNFSETPGDTMRTFATMFRSSSYVNYHEAGQALIMWGEQGHDFKAQIRYRLNDSTEWTSPFYSTDSIFAIDDTIVLGDIRIPVSVMAEHDYPFGNSHRSHIQIDAGKSPEGTLELFITANSGTVHAWNVWNLENHAGNTGFSFYSNDLTGYSAGDNMCNVSEPGCASKCITVAAHGGDRRHLDGTETIGGLADFSSRGPLINGVEKPEISAPGVDVVSSFNTYRTDRDDHVSYTSSFGATIYEWGPLSGTSMSSPAVTGIVALMLQANPYLTVDDVRECLFTTTRNDNMTGPLRERDSISYEWGWGKADALRAVNAALRKLSVKELEVRNIPLMLCPNPASDRVSVMTGSDIPTAMTVYSIDGRRVMERMVTGETEVDIAPLPRGVYVVRVGARVAKLVKH